MTKSGKNRRTRIIGAVVASFFVLIMILSGAFAVYSFFNFDRVYANQYVGNINLAKRTRSEVRDILTKEAADFSSKELILRYKGEKEEKTYKIKPSEVGLHYDAEATTKKVWDFGREGDIASSSWHQMKSIFVRSEHEAVFTINQGELEAKIKTIAKEIDLPEKDYSITYKEGKFVLSDQQSEGRRIDQAEITTAILNHLRKFESSEVAFVSKIYAPKVKKEKALARLLAANRILEKGELIAFYEGQEFKFDKDMIGGTIKSQINKDDLEILLDDKRLNTFLDTVGGAINVEPRSAKLTINNSRATIFETSRDGKSLSGDISKERIKSALLSRAEDDSDHSRVELVVEVKKPEIAENDIGNLGITELVASASTEFKGSPANRIHNIQTGAAAINGVLVKPGETFSTLARLGAIDGSTGYLPELVIKEDRTVPEFGGGLCQVSTTLFRSALNAGMKIVERSNHSYRVGYYEPPVGMDATIYDPAPDFKFSNNYSSHILIQSKVEGTKITFELYGTKDGRQVEIGQPVVYDYTNPSEPINIETDTLPPGERKQIEKPHQGASAKFHYKSVRNDEVLQERDFFSKYVPWPEKWLVGKQPVQPQPETVPQPEPAPASESQPQ